MRQALLFSALLAACSAVNAQAVDKESAIVTLTGAREFMQQTTVNGQAITIVIMRLEKSTRVHAQVHQTVDAISKLDSEDLPKRLERDRAPLEEVRKANDVEKVKKLQKELLDKILDYAKNPPATVEGRLTVKDKQMWLTGVVRPFLAAGKTEAPPPGSAVVEGEVLPGEHVFGKEQKSPLAIKNGPTPIIVTGKLATEHAQAN